MSDEEKGSKLGAAGELIAAVLALSTYELLQPGEDKMQMYREYGRVAAVNAPKLAKALRVAIGMLTILKHRDEDSTGSIAKVAIAEINAICAVEKPATRGEEEK